MLKTKEEIKEWLDKMEIENYTINEDLTVDVSGHVELAYNGLTEIPVQFRIVEGDFDCHVNQLTTLKGCPEVVNGGFYCHSNKLTTLEGGPKIVRGEFDCPNNQLTTLKGCPQVVNGDFNCSENNLTSFEYLPLKVDGDFYHDGIEEQGIEPNTPLEELHKRNDIIKSKQSLESELKSKDLNKERVKRPRMKI